MGTGTPITRRDCCAIKLRERAYLLLRNRHCIRYLIK
jgi:hypothetical protein